ncbi:hypothetical protein [Mycolicibacterium llatzerense]|nr:hypothetical protein [Mycolicibacterium llatzerense]
MAKKKLSPIKLARYMIEIDKTFKRIAEVDNACERNRSRERVSQ